jgi:hypothetical protein
LFAATLPEDDEPTELRVGLPLGAYRPIVAVAPTETDPFRKLVWRSASGLGWLLALEYYVVIVPTRRGVRLYHGLILDGLLANSVHRRRGAELHRELTLSGKRLARYVRRTQRPSVAPGTDKHAA